MKFSPVQFVIVLGSVAVFAGVLAVAVPRPAHSPPPQMAQPTPAPADATANWKVYRNDKYGFELRYPNSSSLEETQDRFSITLQKYSGYSAADFIGLIEKTESCSDAEKYLSDHAGSGSTVDYGTIITNGLSIRKARFPISSRASLAFKDNYFLVHNNRCFIFSFSLSSDEATKFDVEQQFTEVEQNIISTLRFLQ